MRTRLAILALVLLSLTVSAPAIEPVAGCLELCADESPGQDQCSSDACCSCCIHSGPLFTSLPAPATTLVPAGVLDPPTPVRVPPVLCADILHVPKLTSS
jgi:hypothetical protein